MSSKPDKKFLNRYFRGVYDKLEADVLRFNKQFPHNGLKGSENEKALENILRDFLPAKYGIESNCLIIDRNGNVSKECDIVIYDSINFPRYFRKVYPIELIYAVIEVKTQITKQQADIAIENESVLRNLEFYPLLTPYWQTRTKEEQIPHYPPLYCIFGYGSASEDFGTFIKWFSLLPSSTFPNDNIPYHPSFNHFIVCALDKGIIFCRGDGNIAQWLAVAEGNNQKNIMVLADGRNFQVDPAKALFLFLYTLWTILDQSPRHPGFDIRSYIDYDLGTVVSFDHEGKIEHH